MPEVYKCLECGRYLDPAVDRYVRKYFHGEWETYLHPECWDRILARKEPDEQRLSWWQRARMYITKEVA